jgi:hypothetical protein
MTNKNKNWEKEVERFGRERFMYWEDCKNELKSFIRKLLKEQNDKQNKSSN